MDQRRRRRPAPLRRRDDWQRLPVGLDQVERIASAHRVVGQHGGHRFAGIARYVRDQQRVVDLLDVRARTAATSTLPSPSTSAPVRTSTTPGACCACSTSMQTNRACGNGLRVHGDVQQVRDAHVFHVLPRARDQPAVLKAAERFADPTHMDRVRDGAGWPSCDDAQRV